MTPNKLKFEAPDSVLKRFLDETDLGPYLQGFSEMLVYAYRQGWNDALQMRKDIALENDDTQQ